MSKKTKRKLWRLDVDGSFRTGVPSIYMQIGKERLELPTMFRAHAEEAVACVNAHNELVAALRDLSEGWMQRNHPDSPGVTITDSQMTEAAYSARAILAKVKI